MRTLRFLNAVAYPICVVQIIAIIVLLFQGEIEIASWLFLCAVISYSVGLYARDSLKYLIVIGRMGTFIEEQAVSMKKDHDNGVKVINWYKDEVARLTKENTTLKESIKRLTDINHLKLEQNENSISE